MSTVVVQKPKEKEEVRHGWRVKVRHKVIVKEKGVRERRIAEEKEKSSRAAHNVMLIRVRGVKRAGDEGLLARIRGWVGSLFGRKRKQA